MYEELVKRLRDISNNNDGIKSNYIGLTMLQAANAIEDLSEQINEQEVTPEAEHFIDKYADRILSELQELKGSIKEKPRWIPVTERLPDEFGRYLCRYRVEDGETIGYCTDFGRYDPEHGEWYAGTVTHWMPLPEPPKEATT